MPVVIPTPPPLAGAIPGQARTSFGDGKRAVEILVLGAAEDIAAKGERTHPIGNQMDPRDLSGDDVRSHLQLRQIESVRLIRGRQLRISNEKILNFDLAPA